MSTAERYDDYRGYRQDRWCGPSVRFHPGWIVLMILGFQTGLLAFIADLLSVNRRLLEELMEAKRAPRKPGDG